MGVSKCSVENFLSQIAEIFRRGIYFRVSTISNIKKILIQRVMPQLSIFCRRFFCLTVPKISVGEFFSVSLFSGIEKNWIRWGVVSRFCVEIFLSHSAEKLRRGTLSCFTSFGYRKSLCFRGFCHDFRFPVEDFLSQRAEIFRR